jgi:hypothetical protein
MSPALVGHIASQLIEEKVADQWTASLFSVVSTSEITAKAVFINSKYLTSGTSLPRDTLITMLEDLLMKRCKHSAYKLSRKLKLSSRLLRIKSSE